MPKIRKFVDSGFVGCKREDFEEYDDEEWAEMSEEERNEYLDEAANEFLHNNVDYDAYVVEN